MIKGLPAKPLLQAPADDRHARRDPGDGCYAATAVRFISTACFPLARGGASHRVIVERKAFGRVLLKAMYPDLTAGYFVLLPAPTGRCIIGINHHIQLRDHSRVKAVDLRIKLASESSFTDYTSFVSISHISEKKEQRGARPNIFLAGVHGGIYKAGLCGERGAALEPKCVTNSAPDGILWEWAPALLMGSHENCISFDQTVPLLPTFRILNRTETGRRGGIKKQPPLCAL